MALAHRRSFLSRKVEARAAPGKGGWGVFVRKPIRAGEIVGAWGGEIRTAEELSRLPNDIKRHSVQVEEGYYQIALPPYEPAEYINHSCDPTVGMAGQITLVALRDLEPGEEICLDYAMCDGSPYAEFDCACGSSLCRGRVTGEDWRRPELQVRYRGFFSPYLQRRIDGHAHHPLQRSNGHHRHV